MTNSFYIGCEWSSPSGSTPEVAETSAFIEIGVGNESATRCDNEFSGSVTNRVLLSAYPLALWLASSWWRLRWESGQQRREPSLDWKMSHSLAAAGGGFLWPALTFESDGESIKVSMQSSGRVAYEPIKYIGQFTIWLGADEFELVARQFVEKVLWRLTERGLPKTQLHDIWDELSMERADSATAEFRRTEAILGFDAGEAPDEAIQRIDDLKISAGFAAADEIAYASAGNPKQGQLTAAMVLKASVGAPAGRIDLRPEDFFVSGAGQLYPWRRGYALASQLRSRCGWSEPVVSDHQLAGLLGIVPATLTTQNAAGRTLPFGLAVRASDRTGQDRFVFRSAVHVRRRFDAARMLADHLLAPASDTWLPTTATHTARQKTQRAFAAQLLCPYEALKDFMGDEISDDQIEDAALHFDVSFAAVKFQLANQRR